MSKKIHHHWITESYQRNFAGKDGLIWVLEPSGKIYKTSPDSKFKERHFYTVFGSLFAEEGFSRIEGDFNKIVKDKIFHQKPLEIMERIAFSMFLALMLNKTKGHRENIKQFLQNIIQETGNDKYSSETETAAIPNNGKGVSIEEIKRGMKHFDSFHTIATINSSRELTAYILNMSWIIFNSQEGEKQSFICSDSPLHLCAPEREKKYGVGSFGSRAGLRHKDVELTFPISSKVAVLAGYNKGVNLMYKPADPRVIKQINYRTARGAEQLFANNRKILEDILARS